MEAYSYSKIKKYFNCPRQYKYHYKENLRGLEPVFFEKGKIGHEIIEVYTKYCQQNKFKTDYSFLLKITEDYVNQFPLHKDFIYYFSEQIKNILIPERIIGTEMKIAIDNNKTIVDNFFAKNIFFRLIADLIYFDTNHEDEDIVVVRDYKTGYSTDYDLEQLENEAFVMHILFPNAKQICVEFAFINENRYFQTSRYTVSNFENIETRIRQQIKTIESDKQFKPIGGNHCSYCPHLNRCMQAGGIILREETLFPDRPITKETASMVAEFYERLQIYSKKIALALEGYCKENGNIQTKDNVYGIDIKPTVTAPYLKRDESKKNELTTTLEKAGVDIPTYINLDSRKLNKVKKELNKDQIEKLKNVMNYNPAGKYLQELGYSVADLGNYDSAKIKELAETNNDIKKCLIENPNEKYTVIKRKEIEANNGT